MISYAILLGFLCQHLREFLENRRRRSFILYSFFFILVSILLSAWPLLSGDIYGQLKPHQIPDDYYQLRNFLQSQAGDFRVMVFPRTDWLVAYSWSAPFDMQEILLDFSPKDMIINPVGYLQGLEKRKLRSDDPLYAVSYYILGRFKEDSRLDLQEALDGLRLMGVKYLVVHHDYVHIYKDFPAVYTQPLEDTLKEIAGISFVKSFGDLDVYEVGDFLPRIYALVEGQTRYPGLTLDYQRISPVEYKIAVRDVENPYTLVFSENFNRGWQLDGKEPSGSLTRGFGNVWLVDKTGDYNLRLYYWPQKLLEIGFLVSTLSLVGGAFVLALKKK